MYYNINHFNYCVTSAIKAYSLTQEMYSGKITGEFGKFKVPQATMSPPKEYDRTSGFTNCIELDFLEVYADYDKEVVFDLPGSLTEEDNLDRLTPIFGEYIKTQICPDLDKHRLCCLVNNDNVKKEINAGKSRTDNFLASMSGAWATLRDEGVSKEDIIIYMKNSLYGEFEDLDCATTRYYLFRKYKDNIRRIPDRRMPGGVDAIVVPTPAVDIGLSNSFKMIKPEENQESDSYKACFRVCRLTQVKYPEYITVIEYKDE